MAKMLHIRLRKDLLKGYSDENKDDLVISSLGGQPGTLIDNIMELHA